MRRRQTMQALILGTLWPSEALIAAAPKLQNQLTPYADPEAADQWMRTWMSQPKAASGMLNVERFADRYYYLRKKIRWTPDEAGTTLPNVTVPVGFVTDFASIPRVAWSMLPPDGNYTYPAVVHDFLYWSQTTTRKQADEIFRLMMKEFGVAGPVIATIHAGVRAGGQLAWSNNDHLKKSGERRILKVFPKDPKILWEDWKKRDVF